VTVNWHAEDAPDTPALIAVQSGERRPSGDGVLLQAALAVPLMTAKVLAAIHWQALKIWLRGGRYHPKPAPPDTEISR